MKPTHSECKTGIDKTVDKVRNRETLKREVGGHFGENVHDTPDDERHDDITHQQGRRTDGGEGGAAAYE